MILFTNVADMSMCLRWKGINTRIVIHFDFQLTNTLMYYTHKHIDRHTAHTFKRLLLVASSLRLHGFVFDGS